MTKGERLFMFLFGVLILLGLYFDRPEILSVIAVLSLFEGMANFRISRQLSLLLGESPHVPVNEQSRFSFDAIRAWRLVIGSAVLLSGVFFLTSYGFSPGLLVLPWPAQGSAGYVRSLSCSSEWAFVKHAWF